MPAAEAFVDVIPGETRLAVVEAGRLAELVLDRTHRPSRLDGVYLGRVAQVARGLDAVFVDIGLPAPGLLNLRDMAQSAPKPKEGDALVVKVERDAVGDKGMRLTAKFADSPDPGGAAPPAELMAPPAPVMRRLAELKTAGMSAVTTDDARLQRRLVELGWRAAFHGGAIPLFEEAGIADQVADAFMAEVPLPSGGRLIIEPTAALTAIDVDSGTPVGSGRGAETASAVNAEAAVQIAHQIRLRNLAGQILVDFLPMATGAARDKLLSVFRGACDGGTNIHGFTSLGLVELTRHRRGWSLFEAAGSMTETAAFEVIRAALRRVRSDPGRRFTVAAAPPVVAQLTGLLAAAWDEAQRRIGQEVELRAEAGLGLDGFEFVEP